MRIPGYERRVSIRRRQRPVQSAEPGPVANGVLLGSDGEILPGAASGLQLVDATIVGMKEIGAVWDLPGGGWLQGTLLPASGAHTPAMLLPLFDYLNAVMNLVFDPSGAGGHQATATR